MLVCSREGGGATGAPRVIDGVGVIGGGERIDHDCKPFDVRDPLLTLVPSRELLNHQQVRVSPRCSDGFQGLPSHVESAGQSCPSVCLPRLSPPLPVRVAPCLFVCPSAVLSSLPACVTPGCFWPACSVPGSFRPLSCVFGLLLLARLGQAVWSA